VVKQAEKATLAAYGTPKDALEELDLDPILDSVTEEHADRIRSGIEGKFRVYPKSDGLYTVESMKEGQVKSTYTVNMKSGSACSCRDYLMRCTGQNMGCKHIWRVRVLIKLDSVPGRTQDPFSWLISELYKDMDWLSSSENDLSEYVERIEELKSNLDSDGRQNAKYKHYIQNRADILIKATASDL
jgi:hypothetical protein